MKKHNFMMFIKYVLTAILIISIVSFILYEKDHLNTLAENNEIQEDYVYPVGIPAGIYLKTEGVMVINIVGFKNQNGKLVNPSKNKIKPGDYITMFNDTAVGNKAQLKYLIEENKDKKIRFTIKSNQEYKKVSVTPVQNEKGEYRLGIWIRDDMQSIGTISFITEDNKFFSLGHGICDVDTGQLLKSDDGSMYKADIWGIKKGKAGYPGGLCGSIDYAQENKIGEISLNTKNGIWGKIYSEDILKYKKKKIKIGHTKDITTGAAKIELLLNDKIKSYDIEIININSNSDEKNMVIKITDYRLLKQTNGIVQGMSGCPIIQNDKIVGILTHVMVNNPQYGYGVLFDKITG